MTVVTNCLTIKTKAFSPTRLRLRGFGHEVCSREPWFLDHHHETTLARGTLYMENVSWLLDAFSPMGRVVNTITGQKLLVRDGVSLR
eukprot:4070583-Pyramimonas_sp.AAC.1